MRVLIFGTTYCDTAEKEQLTRTWGTLHHALNPECDQLLVDSASPVPVRDDSFAVVRQLGDNIGHLSRGGQDGWGRAFCTGLHHAIDECYDYAVHIEGDSLCRLDVMKICEQMRDSGGVAWSAPVCGTRRVEKGWVETGLMFLDVEYVDESRLVGRYNWRDGASKKYPHTPEIVLHDLFGEELEMQNWSVTRDDQRTLTVDNVVQYDWITHTTPAVYSAFVAKALERA